MCFSNIAASVLLFEHLEFETTDLTFKLTALPISWWFQVLSAPYLQGTSTAQMQVSMSWTDNMTFPITHFPPKQQCPLSALLWNTSCMWSTWTRHCPIEKCCYVFHPLHHWKLLYLTEIHSWLITCAGVRSIQSKKQRFVSRTDLVHCWHCSQQWSRYLGPHQEPFSQIQ